MSGRGSTQRSSQIPGVTSVGTSRPWMGSASRCLCSTWGSASVGEVIGSVLDNAPAHRWKDARIPENVLLVPLPPHGPELNPVERLFLEFRRELANQLFDSIDAIQSAATGFLERYWADRGGAEASHGSLVVARCRSRAMATPNRYGMRVLLNRDPLVPSHHGYPSSCSRYSIRVHILHYPTGGVPYRSQGCLLLPPPFRRRAGERVNPPPGLP